MSFTDLAKSFKNNRLSVNEFANSFMELWEFEKDINLLQRMTMI